MLDFKIGRRFSRSKEESRGPVIASGVDGVGMERKEIIADRLAEQARALSLLRKRRSGARPAAAPSKDGMAPLQLDEDIAWDEV